MAGLIQPLVLLPGKPFARDDVYDRAAILLMSLSGMHGHG